MLTENRSSNTDMVSVQRERLHQFIEYSASVCKSPAWVKDKAALLAALDQPAPQPHPNSIAWMVGTAFWWTKEEAERDAAETGLPIVGLGPMTGIAPAERQLGEPVCLDGATFMGEPSFQHSIEWYREGISKHWKKICDLRAEVERLRKACEAEFRSVETLNEDNQKQQAEIERLRKTLELVREQRDNELRTNSSIELERDTLRAQLADLRDGIESQLSMLRLTGPSNAASQVATMLFRHDTKFSALSASAEPSAPVERGPWQPLATPGQVQDGDWLSFTVAGRFICAQARLVINPGTDKEEIVYNRQKNHYFVTSMAVDGSSTHKGVRVAKAKS
ncbi:hypothetical protein [Pseudomonas fulva]